MVAQGEGNLLAHPGWVKPVCGPDLLATKMRIPQSRPEMANQRKSERRRHFRGSARPGRTIDIKWRAKGSADDHQTAITRNIGVGGAFVVTDSRPPIGSLVELIIEIPDQPRAISLTAEVRWVAEGAEGTKGGLGARFLDLDVPSRLTLSEYFATLNGPVGSDDPESR